MKARRLFLALVTLAAGVTTTAEPVSAQAAWDSPILASPGGRARLGLYLVEPSPGDIGAMVTFSNTDRVGYRIGLADDAGGDLAVFGGVDLKGILTTQTREFPLDVFWYTGAGIGLGDAVLVTFPLGVSIGRTVTDESLRLTPYVAPRLVLDAWLGDDESGREEDIDLGLAIDLGLDLAFSSRWEMRVGLTVGDHDALAVGVGFPTR